MQQFTESINSYLVIGNRIRWVINIVSTRRSQKLFYIHTTILFMECCVNKLNRITSKTVNVTGYGINRTSLYTRSRVSDKTSNLKFADLYQFKFRSYVDNGEDDLCHLFSIGSNVPRFCQSWRYIYCL